MFIAHECSTFIYLLIYSLSYVDILQGQHLYHFLHLCLYNLLVGLGLYTFYSMSNA